MSTNADVLVVNTSITSLNVIVRSPVFKLNVNSSKTGPAVSPVKILTLVPGGGTACIELPARSLTASVTRVMYVLLTAVASSLSNLMLFRSFRLRSIMMKDEFSTLLTVEVSNVTLGPRRPVSETKVKL